MQYIIKKNSWHYKMLKDISYAKLLSLKESSPYGLYCRYWRTVVFTILFNITPIVLGAVMLGLMLVWFILAPYAVIASWVLDNSFSLFCTLYDPHSNASGGTVVYASILVQSVISIWAGIILVREKTITVFPKYISVPFSRLINYLHKKFPEPTPTIKLAKEVPVAPPSAVSVFASSVKSKICPMATFEE